MLSRLIYLILFSSTVYAQNDQWVLDAGIGISNSYSARTISIGIQEDIWGSFKQRLVAGGWIDGSNDRSGSAFITGQLGFEVNSYGLVTSVFSGPGLITNTDSLLGSYFEFITDLHFGLQDGNMNYLGIIYRHVSSAGLGSPNIGRDFVGIEVKI